ncbi:glycosyltransferase family 4 protein [Delftia acidovorans]|uniref:glycosyltransferase family 4 protein n=1 Tax=Delftia acidovorans TaxID=80866 RepID=UPI001C85CA8D|nr:glycosyltransferase family 4 protein [Delftia acidovorans]
MAMRIAFLCKRRYMGKDVILDRYARLYEIPRQLALLGHEVRGYCLDYHTRQADAEVSWRHQTDAGSLLWASESVHGLSLPRLAQYPWHLLDQLKRFRPHVLVGASDIPHVALTRWLARRLGLPYAVDLYDNFEGFGQARIPGFVPALRKATRNASLVVTTSEPLRQMVLKDYGAQGQVVSMPSSVDLHIFCRGDKSEARRRLGLPEDMVLIGTAGGLHKDKGVEPLYRAWANIAARHPTARLVLAGPYRPELPPPQGDRVHYLGHLDHAQVADLFRALDVGVISILDTPFGRYCFPQKAYEMLACGLSVVVADIGEMSALFARTPQIMFPPGDADGLARALEHQLSMHVDSRIPVQGWPDLIAGIEPILLRMAEQSTASGRS